MFRCSEVAERASLLIDGDLGFWPRLNTRVGCSASSTRPTRSMSNVTCCIFPRISVKRTSTYLTSFSLICARMSLAVVFPMCLDPLGFGCGFRIM